MRLRSIQNFFAGRVSKNTLLTKLLPLSFVLFFGTLFAAVIFFPDHYDWRERVISNLTSPRDNPHVYWLPSIGVAAAALLALPFAGYLGQRLRAIAPRVARTSAAAFSLGFLLLMFAGLVVPQHMHPVFGVRRLHEILARTAAAAVAFGMLCCCACALKDRLLLIGGQRSLRAPLAFCWGALTLLPIGGVTVSETVLLGCKAHQVWAGYARGFFQHTVLWHLAFWEWTGAAVVFMFLAISALLLPERTE